MRTKEQKEYLTDEQLERLIADVQKETYRAPDYLEQVILRKAEPEFVKESVEIVPIRHALREGKPLLPQKPSRRKQLQMYGIKVAAVAAAAIALVILTPNFEQMNFNRKDTTVMQNINQKTSDFCSAIYEKTNQLFQKGEK